MHTTPTCCPESTEQTATVLGEHADVLPPLLTLSQAWLGAWSQARTGTKLFKQSIRMAFYWGGAGRETDLGTPAMLLQRPQQPSEGPVPVFPGWDHSG